mmetsp:Transcript_49029/g.112472  ORF Transcript_49029/g.112472 Transcript_49029/m.112472 type:complete len:224 (-) Transcript_49029:963-1634(-)
MPSIGPRIIAPEFSGRGAPISLRNAKRLSRKTRGAASERTLVLAPSASMIVPMSSRVAISAAERRCADSSRETSRASSALTVPGSPNCKPFPAHRSLSITIRFSLGLSAAGAPTSPPSSPSAAGAPATSSSSLSSSSSSSPSASSSASAPMAASIAAFFTFASCASLSSETSRSARGCIGATGLAEPTSSMRGSRHTSRLRRMKRRRIVTCSVIGNWMPMQKR